MRDLLRSTWPPLAAIARRDLAIERSYPFRPVVRVLRVLPSIVLLVFLAKVVDGDQLGAYRGRYLEFVLVGFLVMALVPVALNGLTRAITSEQEAGTLEVLLTSAVRLPVLLTAAFVVPLGFGLAEVVVYVGAGIGFGAHFSASSPPIAFGLLVLTAAALFPFGVVSAALFILTKRSEPFVALATQATIVLSGCFFPVSVFPGWLQAAAKLLPAYHGVEAMRQAVLQEAGIGDIAGEAAILVAFVVVLAPLSLLVFRWAVRVGRATATLGTY